MDQVKIRNHQKLHKCLTKKGWLLADGATGTNLFKKGLETGYPPELWNIEAPQKISALHKEFVEAGADIILTNTFGGNSLRLKLHNAENRVKELNIASAKLAREAADFASRDVLVAGSIGPTGELFSPLGTLDMIEAEAIFSQQQIDVTNLFMGKYYSSNSSPWYFRFIWIWFCGKFCSPRWNVIRINVCYDI